MKVLYKMHTQKKKTLNTLTEVEVAEVEVVENSR